MMMKITESNYEEYFLLYIDEELNDVERNAVEDFVQKNPQFAAMLQNFRKAKLSLDEELFVTDKNSLYKTEDGEIGIDNYEQFFLLYTDNELSKKDKANTERFVLQHPQLQTEFTLLQQTKLQIENIEFQGKEKLYKKEKTRRVIPFYFTRIAVAAVMMTIVVLAWQFSSHRINNAGNVAMNSQPKKQVVSPLVKPEILNEDKSVAQNIDQSQSTVLQQPKVKLSTDKQNKGVVIAKPESKKEMVDMEIAKLPEVHNDVQTLSEEKEIAIQQQPTAEVNKQAEVLKPLEEVSSDESDAQTASSLSSEDNTIAQPAVYKELNTEDDNHTLYVGAFQLNKTKVNGFLKSASRLLGSHSKAAATE